MIAKALEGNVALVTGAGRGIGRAIALGLANLGCTLELAARTASELEETAASCRRAGAPEAGVRVVDLADGRGVDTLCDALLADHGAIDVLVNNAGVFAAGNALEGDPDAWAEVLAVNTLAPMRLIRRLAPKMVERERGTIVNIGSIAAIEGMRGPAVYAASKFALRGFSLSSYERLRDHGIKVVLIHPGYVATPMTAGHPARHDRMMTPDDIAAAALLAVTTSPMCCPQEITLRLTKRADP
jgi:NAD(P)-dependent dehydrogenase (short-subunit alcohol dehydrogenase family)